MIIDQMTAFQWDYGNQKKNFLKHHVSNPECEEAFFDHSKKIFKDVLHSANEHRFILLGKTKNDRVLFVVFTLRSAKVRVISARELNLKERHLYD
jgi:hypothetical protein